MTTMMNFVTALVAFLALIAARIVISWVNSYDHYREQMKPSSQLYPTDMRHLPLLPHENAALVAINYMGQHNQMIMSSFLSIYQKMMDEMISDLSSEKKQEKSENYEILCKDEFIEEIKKLMDSNSEKAVKEMAMWATEHAEMFSLVLNRVSIETDSSGDSNHPFDVLIVFHVKGAGENALRFQSEASRFLRDIVSKSEHASLQLLRPDVRWQ